MGDCCDMIAASNPNIEPIGAMIMGLFSKDIASMDDLFVHQLQDIYYAEKRIVGALPDMIAKASSPRAQVRV